MAAHLQALLVTTRPAARSPQAAAGQRAYVADFDAALIGAHHSEDPDIAAFVVTYAAPDRRWLKPETLAASLPVAADPYLRQPWTATVAEGRHFDDTMPGLSVPGLAGDFSPSVDTIAVARAMDGATAAGDAGGRAAMMTVAELGAPARRTGPVDIGQHWPGTSTIASSEPAPKDVIIIMPVADSLLGGEFADAPVAHVTGDVRTLRGAVALALEHNPEIGQAVANREAIEFELAQGRGLYLPSVDLEARAGVQVVDNGTTRFNGDDDHLFTPVEGRITLTQVLFDGFAIDAEVERQASRVDGASFRVLERSEFIALNVIRAHQDTHRLTRILALARDNLAFHRRILDDLTRGASAGAISVADRQQAEERIIAAEAFISLTREQLEAARITFNRLVGQFPTETRLASSVAGHLPPSLNHAVAAARANNPIVKIADAAISTAYAETRAAESAYWPQFNLELTGRAGEDLDGVRGRDSELRAMVVMAWNLYHGGVKPARVQERIRRVDEERQKLFGALREAEETMRISWDQWHKQQERLAQRQQQLSHSMRLLNSYQEQFNIGQRSLLDVLDTQNTRFTTEIAVETSRHAVRFAEYRILASAGMLLPVLGIAPPPAAEAYARADAAVAPVPGAEAFVRTPPDRP